MEEFDAGRFICVVSWANSLKVKNKNRQGKRHNGRLNFIQFIYLARPVAVTVVSVEN